MREFCKQRSPPASTSACEPGSGCAQGVMGIELGQGMHPSVRDPRAWTLGSSSVGFQGSQCRVQGRSHRRILGDSLGASCQPLHSPAPAEGPHHTPVLPSLLFHPTFHRKCFPARSNYRVNNGPSLAVNVLRSFITNRREMTQKDITHGVAGNYFYGCV